MDRFELPTHVYRLDPVTGDAAVVVSRMARPNGLCFSPDEKRFYVVDTGQPAGEIQPIRVFDVIDGRTLGFATLMEFGRKTASMTARKALAHGCFLFVWPARNRLTKIAVWHPMFPIVPSVPPLRQSNA